MQICPPVLRFPLNIYQEVFSPLRYTTSQFHDKTSSLLHSGSAFPHDTFSYLSSFLVWLIVTCWYRYCSGVFQAVSTILVRDLLMRLTLESVENTFVEKDAKGQSVTRNQTCRQSSTVGYSGLTSFDVRKLLQPCHKNGSENHSRITQMQYILRTICTL